MGEGYLAMSEHELGRRRFLKGAAAGLGAVAVGDRAWSQGELPLIGSSKADYSGPNVIIVRFGGGVRRQETILDPPNTYSPFFLHDLAKRGTLYTNMMISQLEGVETNHGQGTLYILTGKYDKFKDVGGKFLGERFEAQVPTIFEYLRKSFNVPEHQTLIVNGEDRTDEEFYSFSNHHAFGASYRSNVLSLYRFKIYLLRRQIAEGNLDEKAFKQKSAELAKNEALDYRVKDASAQSPEITAFWERWRRFYGDSGFVNPRGDRLLTELTLRAMKELRPKMLMVNYNDPDYVHWGNASHYTRGISIIDQGLQQLFAAVEADEVYRDNTVFVIVPDCGRDSNRALSVPFQHHSNTRSSHEIFALFVGTGIAKGQVIDREVNQISIAGTVGHIIGTETAHTEGPVLDEVFV